MTLNELLEIIQKYYPNAEIKHKVIAIDSIDIDIEPTQFGFTLYLGDFHRKKVNNIEHVFKELGIYDTNSK